MLEKTATTMVENSGEYSTKISIGTLYKMHKEGTLILQPAYQRKYVMAKAIDTQDSLIQSILQNPNHYVAFVVLRKREDGILEVLDGQQRLTMYFQYLDLVYSNFDPIFQRAGNTLSLYLQRCDIISRNYSQAVETFTNLQKSKPLKKSEIAKNNVPSIVLESLASLDNMPIFAHTFGANLNYLSRECMGQIILVASSTDKKIDIDGNAASAIQADFTLEDMDYLANISDFLTTEKKKPWHKKSYLPVIFPIAEVAKNKDWTSSQFTSFLTVFFGKTADVPKIWQGSRKDFTDFAGSNSASASHVKGRFDALYNAFLTAIPTDYTATEKTSTGKKNNAELDALKAQMEAQNKEIARLKYLAEQAVPSPIQQGLTDASPAVTSFIDTTKEVEQKDLVITGVATSNQTQKIQNKGKSKNKK